MARWCKKCPSKACICAVLSVVLFIAVCTVITCGFIYLKPFLQVVRYRETVCRVESSFYTTQYVCPCGAGCISTYPCYLVLVSLNHTDGEQWVVTLYQDDTQQSSILSLDHDKQEKCSLRWCKKNAEQNRVRVMNFEHDYGRRGSNIKCLYDPWDVRTGAVLKVVLPGMQVFHAMLWPLVIIAVDVIICVIFCKRCRRHDDNTDAKNAKDTEAGSAIETKPLTVAEEGDKDGAGASGKLKGKSKKGKEKASDKEKGDDNASPDPQAKAKTKSLWI